MDSAFRKRSSYILFLFGISYVFEYLFNAVLARNLSVIDYGQLSLIIKISEICVPIVLLGFDSSLAKLLPPLLKKHRERESQRFLSAFFNMMLSRLFLIYFIACVGCFFVFIMDTTILDSVDFHYPGILITFLIPLLATTLVFNKLMTIFEKYIQAVLVFNVLKFMIATLLLFIAFTKIQEISFFNVFEVLLLSYFIVALTQMLYVIPIIKNNINEIKKAVLEKEWLNLSLSYMINSLVFLLLCTIYFILFRILGDGASVGEFNALILISSILLLVSSASGTVVTPKISALYHNKDFDELQCLINKTFSFDFTVLIIATSSIIALNSYLLGFFGESYLHLNKELIVVAIIVFIGSCNVTVARILVYTNYHKETLLVNVAGIVCSVILGFFLIPNFKLWGGIISFGVVSLTQNVVNFVLIKRKLPLKPFIYF